MRSLVIALGLMAAPAEAEKIKSFDFQGISLGSKFAALAPIIGRSNCHQDAQSGTCKATKAINSQSVSVDYKFSGSGDEALLYEIAIIGVSDQQSSIFDGLERKYGSPTVVRHNNFYWENGTEQVEFMSLHLGYSLRYRDMAVVERLKSEAASSVASDL